MGLLSNAVAASLFLFLATRSALAMAMQVAGAALPGPPRAQLHRAVRTAARVVAAHEAARRGRGVVGVGFEVATSLHDASSESGSPIETTRLRACLQNDQHAIAHDQSKVTAPRRFSQLIAIKLETTCNPSLQRSSLSFPGLHMCTSARSLATKVYCHTP